MIEPHPGAKRKRGQMDAETKDQKNGECEQQVVNGILFTPWHPVSHVPAQIPLMLQLLQNCKDSILPLVARSHGAKQRKEDQCKICEKVNSYQRGTFDIFKMVREIKQKL